MIKPALLAVAGSLALSFSSPAQSPPAVDSLHFGLDAASLGLPTRTHSFQLLNNVWRTPAPLTLADGDLFSFPSAFAWVETPSGEILPDFTAASLPRVSSFTAPRREAESKPFGLVPKFDYVGGEVGIFYGRSTGKYKREVEAGYLWSEIVEGNTHISVGASYQHVSGRIPR